MALCPFGTCSEQLQEHHVRNETVLRVAADGLADVEADERSPRADRLAADAESLERRAVIAGGLVVDERVIVERLDAELLREDEAVREVAEDHLLGANRSGADAVDALRAEESELVFREAVEPLPVEIVDVDADALE